MKVRTIVLTFTEYDESDSEELRGRHAAAAEYLTGWRVQEGPRFADALSWGEMLDHLVTLTMPARDPGRRRHGRFGMYTREEHERRRERLRRYANEDNAQ